ncbi:hypothetical protein [Pedobacter soli]|uniref:Uncharacterized protein n=1 Tax=Pedobacter soli TaxID=390242 RepID=A0A1G6K151_9SPHI|nr:hypothetical protein [Pedobacter soli]SDC24752.1 hypothetical protein SAMN04488024_101623 [Pedobacter soli]
MRNFALSNPGTMGCRGKVKVMLHGFSTLQFLAVLLVLGLLWYGGVLIFFNLRKKMGPLGVASFKGVLDSSVPGKGSDSVTASGSAVADDLMGKARLPEGMSSVGMEDIGFVDLDERDIEGQQGLVPDLLEEIKNVFLVLAKEDSNKRDFFELMKVVKEQYPGMASHPRIRRINEYISDHAAFHLSPEELENLWY